MSCNNAADNTLGVIEMQPITVTVAITEEPDFVAPPDTVSSSFGVAENLMPGVQLLGRSPVSASFALAFLCAHALECLLKAYLSKAGLSDASLRNHATRHNLNALWASAASQGLRIQATPPDWVTCLSGLHGPPSYFLRYATGVHAIVSPGAEPMVSELLTILEVVREQLR